MGLGIALFRQPGWFSFLSVEIVVLLYDPCGLRMAVPTITVHLPISLEMGRPLAH